MTAAQNHQAVSLFFARNPIEYYFLGLPPSIIFNIPFHFWDFNKTFKLIADQK